MALELDPSLLHYVCEADCSRQLPSEGLVLILFEDYIEEVVKSEVHTPCHMTKAVQTTLECDALILLEKPVIDKNSCCFCLSLISYRRQKRQ